MLQAINKSFKGRFKPALKPKQEENDIK
jgi:hypothetical protein